MKPIILAASLALGALGAAAEATASFAMIDANGDGFVSESEFVGWKTSDGTTSAADALIKFIEMDTDASGMVSEAEMEAAMNAAEKDKMPSNDAP